VDDPAEQHEPEEPGQYEVGESGEDSSLEELAQAGDEKATKGCDYVSSGSLSVHDFV